MDHDELFFNNIKKDVTSSNKQFRLLEVVPIGTGKKTKIVYYDTSTYEKFVKESEEGDEWPHIIPSIEINFKKYGYENLNEILNELEPLFPGRFEAKPYGSKRSTDEYSDADFYREGQETGILWYLGDRADKKNLEFFIDEENKKQIFINNIAKRFKPRTRILSDSQIDDAKNYLENFLVSKELSEELSKHEVSIDDLKINERSNYLELICKEPVLKFLDKKLFRINVYDSEDFKKESDAEAYLEEIKKLEGFKIHVDQAKVIKRRKGPFDVRYGVRITSDENSSFVKKLSNSGMTPAYDSITKKRLLKSRENNGDHLFLNSPTQQLRDFFPSHIFYDPEIPLNKQKNKDVPAFKHRGSGNSELEDAVNSAYKFYLNNSVVIDLEVTDYDKNSKDRKNLTGRIFMAVFQSEKEKKIYITKEAWKSEKNKTYFKQKTKDVELVFVEDEIELISSLTKASSKYEYVIGHNFQEYDQRHLAKFNDENKLFKKGKISLQEKERIKQLKKSNGASRLWNKSLKNILDTHKYVKNRVHLLEDYKLATFAGFDKSIDYDEMERLVKSKKVEDIQKIIDYTVEDGEKTKEITDVLLRTATIESFAFNKTFSSVFSSNPVKNFYDAGARDYFMSMKTYKNRHEYSPRHNLEKLEARESPDELIFNLLKREKQKEGMVEGFLVYPKAIIDSCKEIIYKNPTTRLMYEEMLKEDNVLIKTVYLHNLHSAVHVAVDKVKNFMESVGLEFGKRYSPVDVFRTFKKEDLEPRFNGLQEGDIFLGEKTFFDKAEDYFTVLFNKITKRKYEPKPEKEKEKFNESFNELPDRDDEYFEAGDRKFSDFELSRTNFIFCAEYKAHRVFDKKGLIPYDYAMLHINNLIADNVEAMRGGLTAKTQGLYVTDRKQTGLELGRVKGLNFKDKGFIGKLGDYKIFLNRKKPKDELISEMVDYYLDNDVSQQDIWRNFSKELLSQTPEYWNKQRNYIRVLTGTDLAKSGGTPTLFD